MDDPLFTFFGDKNKSQARTLADKLNDINGFRTAIRQTAEGTIMLQTKGGMPRVTVKKEEVQQVIVQQGWWETDFNLREYGDPVLTELSPEMGGFLALVRPITSIDMLDKSTNTAFLLKPFNKVETI